MGAPSEAEKQAAAAIQAPAAPMLAPPLPGQLQAVPAESKPAAGTPQPPVPAPAATTPPRPALAPPPGRIPDTTPPAATPAPSVPLSKAKQASSTSTSGQFIVHGDDLKLRSAFSGRCEEISENLRQLLRDKEPWALPVVVLLKTGDAARTPGPAASTTISQISHGGFHLQVTVNVRGDLRPSDLRAEVVRVLLAERILRNQKQLASNRERLLPDWVFTGVLEAMDYRKRARPSALFAAIFKSGKIYGIEEIIEASAAEIEDGLSKTIYQTSCCALVLALLDQPEGGLRLTKFLNSLAADKRPERELLNQWFPGFAATPASLNKWWSLQMASLAMPSVSEPLTPAETMKQLDDALTLRFKAAPGEVPKPRPVAAAATPANESTPPQASAPAVTAPNEAAADEKKPSLIKRLFTLEKREPSNEEVIALAAAKAESAPAAEPKTGRPQRRSMFSRRSGEENEAGETAAAEKAAAVEKPAASSAAAPPAAAPKADEQPADEDKGSRLNPLNWFRGKKQQEKDAAEPNTKDGQAARQPAAKLLWAWSPLAADVWAMAEAAVQEEPKSRPTEGFLGLKFGRKKKEAAEPEAPKTETTKSEAPKKAAPQSEASKKETASPKAKSVPKKAELAPAAEEPAKKEEGTKQVAPPIKIKRLFGSGKKDEEEAEVSKPGPSTSPPPKAATQAVPASDTQRPSSGTTDAALPIEDYAVVLKRKDRKEILGRSLNALAGLQTRAAVLFRPIVADYSQVVADLMEGKSKGADERLRNLRARAGKALEQSKAVRDFVDVYEANESPVFSGLFEDYLKLPENITNELPPRSDPLSNYLDALDREFARQ
jgi:hypothetical protein